jgi:NADPH-dependent curcumin reductase CurA
MATSRRVLLKGRPVGEPRVEDFEVEDAPVPEPGPGQVLLRTIYLSLDPYMRGRMNEGPSYTGTPNPSLGEVMVGGTVSEVVHSNNDRFAAGDLVVRAAAGYAARRSYRAKVPPFMV